MICLAGRAFPRREQLVHLHSALALSLRFVRTFIGFDEFPAPTGAKMMHLFGAHGSKSLEARFERVQCEVMVRMWENRAGVVGELKMENGS